MRKLFFLVVCLFLTHTTFAQSKNQALHIIFQNVDTTYFDNTGSRWQEFSILPNKAFKVNDFFEADTTLKDCFVIKGSKEYRKYIKENYPSFKLTKDDKKVYAHLDCECENYIILMWMYPEYAFGMITTKTL